MRVHERPLFDDALQGNLGFGFHVEHAEGVVREHDRDEEVDHGSFLNPFSPGSTVVVLPSAPRASLLVNAQSQ